MIWLLTALLTALVTLLLVRPLVRPGATAAAGEADPLAIERTLYQQRLKDIDRDLARGTVTQAESGALKAEAARVLLARWRALDGAVASGGGVGDAVRFVTLAVAVLVPGVTLALYLWLGALGEEIAWQAQRGEARERLQQMEQQLQETPEDAYTALQVARARLRAGERDAALVLLDRAIELSDGDGALLGAVIEARVAAFGGTIDGRTAQLIEAASESAPDNPRVRFYEGYLAEKQGRVETAIDLWVALLADSPADAAWVEPVRQELARLDPTAAAAARTLPPGTLLPGSLPPGAQSVMEMDPAEQAAFMADRITNLRIRLAEDPADLEGWRMLARVERTMGDVEAAAEALAQVATLSKSTEDQIAAAQTWLDAGDAAAALEVLERVAVEAATADMLALKAAAHRELGQIAPMTEALAAALAADPENTLALWISAEMALAVGSAEQARALFDRAIASVPANSPARAQLQRQADGMMAQQRSEMRSAPAE